jgi:hypothetical protein
MTGTAREPVWNVISIGFQALGVILGIAVGASTSPREGLAPLLYMGEVYGICSLLGAVAAGVSLARNERWQPLTFIAAVMNGFAALFVAAILFRR